MDEDLGSFLKLDSEDWEGAAENAPPAKKPKPVDVEPYIYDISPRASEGCAWRPIWLRWGEAPLKGFTVMKH
jgi:hypothetical protein